MHVCVCVSLFAMVLCRSSRKSRIPHLNDRFPKLWRTILLPKKRKAQNACTHKGMKGSGNGVCLLVCTRSMSLSYIVWLCLDTKKRDHARSTVAKRVNSKQADLGFSWITTGIGRFLVRCQGMAGNRNRCLIIIE